MAEKPLSKSREPNQIQTPDAACTPSRIDASVGCFIALGANLHQPVQQLQTALRCIDSHPGLTLLDHSSFYHSEPMGPVQQPDYVNAVCQVETSLQPLCLLDALQLIENEHGRTRDGERWGPRTLDLDLLLYDRQLIDLPRLQVPHPGITKRSFVLVPLLEIAPEIEIPGKGPAVQYTSTMEQHGLVKLESRFEA